MTTVVEGTSVRVSVTVKDSAGVVLDLTGATVSIKLVRPTVAGVLIKSATVTSPAAGTAYVDLSPEENLGPGTATFWAKAIWLSGRVVKTRKQNFTVVSEGD
jgi:hypothetical protein